MQRPQKTSYEGSPTEVGLEVQDRKEACSMPLASSIVKARVQLDTANLLEQILHSDNLNKAYKKVKKNRGSHGIDGMKIDELLSFLKQHGGALVEEIAMEKYKSQSVRRVEIPKPNGGVRLLGIPTVVDRFIQQAIAQVLIEVYDKEFSENSYRFRPGRNAHMAVKKAKEYINEGYTWVVDIDLEKFFDRVNHDILMSILARKIKDERVLRLIRKYLESGVMIGRLYTKTEEGTPQGGPISPILSNILLDVLDKELEARGHKFIRYADDCNIYVKSQRAGKRVMKSITKFLEKKLKLKVNKEKSAVDRPWRRKFLGFSFYLKDDEIRIRPHEKSIKRLKDKIRKITNRNIGISMETRIQKLNLLVVGWVNYFKVVDMKAKLKEIDQ
ncbi:group II intron reverse transcriptase/maturase [Caloranaerobacter azorensis]|nr:group II intron reverse transcriptase/maturase [Caloranaerobacter azorensis]